MALALEACDFDQGALIDDRRSAQQRPGNQYLVLARELPDQTARRVGEDRQPFGQIGARGEFGVRNEIDQNAVEQVDVVGPVVRGSCRNSSAIRRAASARRLGSACLTISSSPGISDVATVIKHTQTRHNGEFSVNLGWLREGRVRSETTPETPQNRGFRPSRALPDRGKTAISAATYGSHTIAY
jgi:hypothetical protein